MNLLSQLMKRAGIAPELTAFGAFYKDDKDEGCAVYFLKDQIPQLKGFSDRVMDMAKGYHKQVGSIPEWSTKEAMIDDLRHQTEQELIPYLNQKFFGSTIRPAKGHYPVNFDLSDKEFIRVIVVFMANVAFLEDVGVIKSDEYNGMVFGNTYSQK